MSKTVCLDASFVVYCVTPTVGSAKAIDLLEAWRSEGAELIAPAFMIWEVGSALKKLCQRGELTQDVAVKGLDLALELPVRTVHGEDIVRSAWRLAERFNLSVLYDACYLAVTEAEGGEFWTADQKLVRQLNGALPYVRLLGLGPSS